MTAHRLLSFTSPRRHRLFAGTALVAYVFAVVGYPVPVISGPRDGAMAYPCQHHLCGCQSAAECWENCCCYTPQQRLAWAREHGVAIPAAVAARLAVAVAEEHQHAAKSCCQIEHHDHDHDCA